MIVTTETRTLARWNEIAILTIIITKFRLRHRHHHNSYYKKLNYRWQTAWRICAMCNGETDPPKTRNSPHNAEFGRSTSKGVSISRGLLDKCGALGPTWGVPVLLQIRPSPRGLPCRIWSLFLVNSTSVPMDIRRKNRVPRVLPFKVTQGYRNRHRPIWHPWLLTDVP